MSAVSSARPIYLDAGGEAVFAFHHAPAELARQTTSVLICPPFGWDDVCSYRSRRAWADQLAVSGFPTLRIDLPSTADSAGEPRDRGRLSAWTHAVSVAAARLRDAEGTRRVAAIGIGIGGLLICRAVSESAAIDEAVLWAVSCRGRAQLRELRAFARLQDYSPKEVGGIEGGVSTLRQDELAAGGFLMSAETVAGLEQLDVATMDLPDGRLQRALLLGRDDATVDARLKTSLEQRGTYVSSADGVGYSTMMAKPQFARSPDTVFRTVASWLGETSVPAAHAAASTGQINRGSGDPTTVELNIGGTAISERPLSIDSSHGKLFGICSEPIERADGLCVVLLNAGAIPHIGPNRMWVEAARRWAARGIPVVRLDLAGIGDADGDAEALADDAEFHVQAFIDQLREALDALQAQGTGSRFVLGGLCSGAYWSLHAALQDERVISALMLNPRAIFWDSALNASRDLRRGLLRPSSWAQVWRGDVSVRRIGALAVRLPFSLPARAFNRRLHRVSGRDQTAQALNLLEQQGKHLQLVFSEHEPLYEEFQKEGRLAALEAQPNVRIELVPGRDHTLRPLESQLRTHELLDRELGRIAERERGPSAIPHGAPRRWRTNPRSAAPSTRRGGGQASATSK